MNGRKQFKQDVFKLILAHNLDQQAVLESLKEVMQFYWDSASDETISAFVLAQIFGMEDR
jgi:hypothetical protein